MRPVKVVHFNQTDVWGGAALAAWRVHRQLLRDGHDSRLVVGDVGAPDPRTHRFERQVPRLEGLAFRFLHPRALHNLHRLSSLGLRQHAAVRDADVIELHNIRDSFSYAMVPWLARRQPVVWVLHDMWAFTGHCAYSLECERWTVGCGACPHLDAFPAMERDASRAEFRLKRFLFNARRLSIVTPSHWLASLLPRSLLARQPARVIPNGVDLATFSPALRDEARRALGVSADTTVLLVASDDLANPRKAIVPWLAALEALPSEVRARSLILAMGKADPALDRIGGVRLQSVGTLTDEKAKARFYAAGDVLLFPSRADNLPLVPIEAVASGTPVLGVAVGGVPEIVVPGRSGWLVSSLAPAEMLRSLAPLLADPMLLATHRTSARALAEERFDIRRTTAAYVALYRELRQESAMVT